MAKFIQIALIATLAVVCFAEPARLKNQRQSRFSARQELAEDIPAQTPYPPAGIVPEIRFDLPSEESSLVPENTYLPPDNVGGIPAQTYGPPEVATDAESTVEEEPVTEVEADIDQPEQSEASEPAEAQVPLNDEAEDNEIESSQLERLVLRRRSNLRSAKLQVRPAARLVAQPVPLRSQRLVAQPIFFTDGRLFAYSPQFIRV